MTNRRALFIVACLGMLTFGIVLTTVGAVLPTVSARFGIDKSAAGSLLFLLSFGILIGSVVFGPMADGHGYKGILLLSFALIVIGFEGIAFATSMRWLRLAVALIGFGGGIINGAANALVADISGDERAGGLSVVGAFFGVGAVGVPFTLGALLGIYGYSTIIGAVGVIVLVPFAITAVTAFPAPKHSTGFPLADASRLLRDPPLLTMGLMLFLESGMEIVVGGWTTTFLQEELRVPDRRALVYLSLFWLGMMLMRGALGFVRRQLSPTRLLLSCLTVALIGALLLITTESESLAALGVFCLGAGFAATFPVLLSLVAARYASLSGTAFSIVMVMAFIGGMLFPYATGVLGETYGLRGSLVIVPATLVLLATLLVVSSSRLASQPAGAA